MADAGNATKAPESDSHLDDRQTTAAPDDTQTASIVGEHCVTDRPTPIGQSSTGEIFKLNDIDVYISKPADYPHAPARLLLLLTGGTGIRSTNNQIQADKYASAGFLVLMPDLFGGDTAPATTAIVDDSPSLLEQFKLKTFEAMKSFMTDMWLARTTADKVMPILHRVIDAANEQYPDAVKQGGGIYAVGYCVGGRFVLLLAKQSQEQGDGEESAGALAKGPYIKAGALAHAASVTPDDFKDLKAPLSLVCIEDDPLFPDAVRSAGEDAMSEANLEHQVQVYPGVPHGFAVVGAYANPSIGDAQATAYEQMLKWIQDH
ncbi:dienelactone hydrolase family protein [Hirsutella rhossiliensis]|uniref:Dienelactone hydrolase family domain-containing protein n=1 Tax=Hirsutella rhossiliensis TaxID=111463 RepID=A0A9P8MQD1_9HYPO|nr:dienelactone hydrolase family domain-containing protein [Hirsutella rhossiliensis]KAH0959507.1 dienelactone hydrolase family domain-containing protein [Hirsutella rhossiliensis]